MSKMIKQLDILAFILLKFGRISSKHLDEVSQACQCVFRDVGSISNLGA